ncbi:hypothetical protein QR680_014534 [Steinernema hermaphroditum]|uniref:Peptidase M13 C-terminal domain-containing protein n=1 Tax=Steinernema hermaphroditum TaxID=289476 RepID=A0AA39IAM0_9BILA|nr:hypothetical protein QR680_014534 [Steinernema hermaphroditum]
MSSPLRLYLALGLGLFLALGTCALVTPCENFHQFVCNHAVATGVADLIEDVRRGFRTKLKKALTADDDPILQVYDEVANYSRTELIDKVNKIHDGRLYDYYNLLFIKYMIEGDLIPRSHVAEYEVIFGKVKKRAIEMVQNAEWIPAKTKSDLLEELTTKRIIFGLPDHLWDLDYIKESISKVQKRFFELRKDSPILSEADPMNSFIKILGATFNGSQDSFPVRLSDVCRHYNGTHAFGVSSNHIFMCPLIMYAPDEHFSLLKHEISYYMMSILLETVTNKTETLMNPEAIECHAKRVCGSKHNWKHDLIVESSRWLIGDMLLKENSNVTRRVDVGDQAYEFTEAQDYMIALELRCCEPGSWADHENAHGAMEIFQRIFGCPGRQESKCHIFY